MPRNKGFGDFRETIRENGGFHLRKRTEDTNLRGALLVPAVVVAERRGIGRVPVIENRSEDRNPVTEEFLTGCRGALPRRLAGADDENDSIGISAPQSGIGKR